MNQTINSKNLSFTINRLRSIGGASLLGLGISISLFISGCGQKGDTDELLEEFAFDVPIAYVRRPVDPIITEDDQGIANPRNALQYKPGGNLFIREYASLNAKEYNITASPRGGFPGTAPLYDVDGNLTREAGDVSDPDVSYDGKKIIFAFRPGDPPNTDPDMQSKWSLWEYVIPTDEDGKITNIHQGTFRAAMTGLTADEFNDIDPVYLPDNSIVFTSDRAERKKDPANPEILLHEGDNNREPAMNLHIMFPGDTSSIKQISFNQSHELDPAVLSSGKIVYSRWEHASRDDNQSPFALFQVSTDGSGHDVLYGAHSFTDIANGVAAFLQAREAQDGTLIATRMSQFGAYLSGDLIRINYKNFIDVNTTRTGGVGQGEDSITEVSPRGGYSEQGRFATPFPLWDDSNSMLVAWAYCEVQDQNGNRELCSLVDNPTNTSEYSFAPPGFGIWMLKEDGKRMSPIVLPEEGWSITDPLALIDRIEEGNYPNATYEINAGTPPACDDDPTLCLEGWESGLVKISSVYDADNLAARGLTAVRAPETLTCADPNNPLVTGTCTGSRTQVSISTLQMATPDERPVRFIRVIGPAKVIEGTNSTRMREILGYHVVEPDGSVVMKVPAGKPFSFELVDKLGHRFSRHPQTWLQVQTGEVVACHGCHAGHTRTTPLNQGSDGASFPGSNPTDPLNDPLLPQVGETMAETLDRVSCADANTTGDVVDGDPGTGCLYRNLSGDLVFRNIWDDPDNVDPDNGDFAIRYLSINFDTDHTEVPQPGTPPTPFSLNGPNVVATRIPVMLAGLASQATETDFDAADCIESGEWQASCRIAINYETHIQSIWEKNRWLDPLNTGTQSNYPCIRCHREYDRNEPLVDNPAIADVPDGQLSLTRTGRHQVRIDTTNFESFVELTADNDVMWINNNGVLEIAQMDDLSTPDDPNDTVDVNVNDCLSFIAMVGNDRKKCGSSNAMDRGRGGNRNYGYFYNRMTQDLTQAEIDAGMVNHNGMLNPAELKMINEWIEVRERQYWGDPFDQRNPPVAPPVVYE